MEEEEEEEKKEKEEEVLHQLIRGLSMFIPCFFGVSTIQSRADSFFRQYGIPWGYFLGMYWTKGKIDISSTKKTWCSGEKKYGGRDIHNGAIWKTRNQQPSKQNGKIWM